MGPTITYIDQATRRPGDQATRRPGDQATRRPGDQATRRPGDQATRRPGDQATRRPGDQATRRPGDQATRRLKCKPTLMIKGKGGKLVPSTSCLFFIFFVRRLKYDIGKYQRGKKVLGSSLYPLQKIYNGSVRYGTHGFYYRELFLLGSFFAKRF